MYKLKVRVKNKWKLAFWICLPIQLATLLFGFYQILDQGMTITHMREGYYGTDNDLETLAELINKTDLTKIEAERVLKSHRLYEYMNFNSDTVALERVNVIFANGRLSRIENQW